MSVEVSKEEKEKALDARIAAIRAKNEKQVQRQKEVERDRRLAEKQNQSITTAPRQREQEGQEVEVVGEVRGGRGREGKRRGGSSSNGRGRDEHIPPFTQRRGGGGGWSDGQDWGRGEEPGPRQKTVPRPFPPEREDWEGGGGPGHTPTATVSPRRQAPPSPPRAAPRPLLQEQVAPPAPFKESSSAPPPLLPQADLGFQQAGVGAYNKQPFSPPAPRPEEPPSLPASNWKCPDPGCRQINGARTLACNKCGIAYKDASDYISNFACERVKQEYQARGGAGEKKHSFSKSLDSTASFTPSQPTNGYSPSTAPPPQPLLQGKDWGEDTGAGWQDPGPGWGAPMDPALLLAQQLVGVDPGTVHQYSMMLAAQQQHSVSVPSFPPPAFFSHQGVAPHQPFYGGEFPQFQGQEQFPPFHHAGMGVYPQYQHAPVQYQPVPRPMRPPKDPALVIPLHHRAPAPQPLALRRPQDQQNWRNNPENKLNRNSLEKDRPPPLVRQVSSENSSNSYSSSRGGVAPRFQRQREAAQQAAAPLAKPPSMIEMQSGSLKKGAATVPPPDPALGLLILGTSNVTSHLEPAEFSLQLRLPVQLEAAGKLEQLQSAVSLLQPARDWLVLVHCLGTDARNIALKRMTDAEKASEADELANQFCDIIEQKLLGAAEHISVLVSMLLPRCDFQEKPGMANPNNVRKVINVQITSRLYENPRVTLINSDKALEWGEDVARLNLLMEGDGYHLTKLGVSLLLETWQEQIRKKMKECNFKSSRVFEKTANAPIKVCEAVAPVVAVEEETVVVPEAPEDPEGEEEEKSPADDEDTVPDPFGSYTAPVELVSPKARTISTSEPPLPEDKDDSLDDDSLPNLEVVVKTQTAQDTVEGKLSLITLEESQGKQSEEEASKVGHTTDEDEEFHDVDDGGFIDDNYCGGDMPGQPAELPSMVSLGPPSSPPLTSGHFLEDSYLPPSKGSLQGRTTVEFLFRAEEVVKIAGDFNSWQPQEMEKGLEPKSWRLSVDLPLGKYQYKYLVRGDWVLDLEAGTATGEEGTTNNFVLVSNDVD